MPATELQTAAPARNQLLPFLGLIFGAAALAYGGVFVRGSELPPTASAVYRVALAAPVFFLLSHLLAGRARPAPVPHRRIVKLVAVGCVFAGNLSLYHWSIHYTTLANSNLLANMAPIFVVVFSVVFFGMRFSRGFLTGMAVALAGAALLLGARLHLDVEYTLGNLFGLLSAVFYGSYFMLMNRVRAEADTFSVMGWSSVGTFIVLLPLAAVVLGEPMIPTTVDGLMTLVALALISHCLGQGAIAYSLAHLPAALSSVTLIIQVVFSALFGWLLLGELPLPTEVVGGIVIIAGILIARRHS